MAHFSVLHICTPHPQSSESKNPSVKIHLVAYITTVLSQHRVGLLTCTSFGDWSYWHGLLQLQLGIAHVSVLYAPHTGEYIHEYLRGINYSKYNYWNHYIDIPEDFDDEWQQVTLPLQLLF